MSTLPKPTFLISANFLGPVLSLDGELTNKAQNLVFARNGIGKSFLSRAFRYLDLHGQARDVDDAASHAQRSRGAVPRPPRRGGARRRDHVELVQP